MHAMRTVGINLTRRHNGRKVRAWDIWVCKVYTGTLVLVHVSEKGRCFYDIVGDHGEFITFVISDDVIEFIA